MEGFGKVSDHSFALALPKVAGNLDCRTRQYKDTAYRPTPDGARAVFGQMLLSVSWDQVTKASNSCVKVDSLDRMVGEMADIAFPVVKVRRNNQDLPFITEELKKLARKTKQEYRRHGRSQRYRVLNEEYKNKFKKRIC